jgi:hypothetical protein
MRIFRPALAGVILVVAAPPVQAIEMQPGLWVLTSKSDRGGLAKSNPTKVKCISTEEAKTAASKTGVNLTERARSVFNDRFGKDNCKLAESSKDDQGVSWLMRCSGVISGEQAGSLKFDSPRHYTAVVKTTVLFQGKSITSTMTSEGRRTGECPR